MTTNIDHYRLWVQTIQGEIRERNRRWWVDTNQKCPSWVFHPNTPCGPDCLFCQGLGFLTVNPIEKIPEKLMLIVTELAEAMEGYRKDLMDDKLPHRKMLEVELADAMIRIFDLAAALELDLGGALIEKMAYNAQRADHQIENRLKPGGKKC